MSVVASGSLEGNALEGGMVRISRLGGFDTSQDTSPSDTGCLRLFLGSLYSEFIIDGENGMTLRLFPMSPHPARRLRRASAVSVFAFVQYSGSVPVLMNNDQSTLQSFRPVEPGSAAVAPLLVSPGDPCGNSEVACDLPLRQQAMDKAQQGDVATAIALFTQLIQMTPTNASYFNNRGLLHFQAGLFQLALWDYHQAIRLNPRLAKVYNNRANCYAAMGQVGEAIADYELAIDLDPTDIRARLNLGITLRQLEWYDRAIETFEMALQLSQFLNTTDTVTISANLEGHLYAERGRAYHLTGDWNCAIADYHRSLDRLALNTHPVSTSQRLRSQVKGWLHELLKPLQPHS